ncbi:hypothetical protein GHT06_010883 [Daphnia sinensis]|uniref:EOG090X03V0 n=1 Tax=Daphnia sinensis TaxID=1820382 RepID=A0AAD5LJZ6_9CRUS|nr:hypothetical protein GHT06_010883 [Daphnia sinensis]
MSSTCAAAASTTMLLIDGISDGPQVPPMCTPLSLQSFANLHIAMNAILLSLAINLFYGSCFGLDNSIPSPALFYTKETKIVSGIEATPGEFPWMAHLTIVRKGRERECGGSLISQNWIMTAAHCVDGADSVTVVLGAHNLSAVSEPYRISLQSTEFYIHPKYSSETFPDDIGLIKLPVSVTFSARIRPVVLTDLGNRDFVNNTVIVTGWGYYSDAIQWTSDVLVKASTTVISNEKCQDSWGSMIVSTMICTSRTRGGVCNGDSGGPMIYLVDGSWVQIGITSFGASPCESVIPNGFTRVQSYLSWITSITGISYTTTTARPTTQTTTAFSCQNDGNKANPADCTTFYMCSNGTPYLFNCPGGLVFNPQLQNCDYRQNVPQCN